jgi:6-phosphogluconolactonase
MAMKFSRLAGFLLAFAICSSIGCGSGSSNSSSTDTMYVATQNSSQIWGYRANFNNGELSNINGSPFGSDNGSGSIVIDPSHNFAYVSGVNSTTGLGEIQRFSIDSNGSFVPITPPTAVVNSQISGMTMDSGGKFLFVGNQLANSVSVFSVGANAALTSVGNFTVVDPVALTVTPNGSFLYVSDQLDNVVYGFSINSSTGALTPLLPPTIAVGSAPAGLATNPAGTFLYVTNSTSNNVYGFVINSDGSLTAMTRSPFASGTGPVAAQVDPSGQFLYVVDGGSNQVSSYRITAVNGDLVATGGSPVSTGVLPVALAISPTNKYLYVSNAGAGTISGFSINPGTGDLTPTVAATTTGLQPAGIAFGR